LTERAADPAIDGPAKPPTGIFEAAAEAFASIAPIRQTQETRD